MNQLSPVLSVSPEHNFSTRLLGKDLQIELHFEMKARSNVALGSIGSPFSLHPSPFLPSQVNNKVRQ